MQHLIIVAVKDNKASVYSQPMYFPTTGMAIRSFQDALADNTNAMAKHPDDYDLYQLGEWDDLSGVFINEKNGPKVIAQGANHKPHQ